MKRAFGPRIVPVALATLLCAAVAGLGGARPAHAEDAPPPAAARASGPADDFGLPGQIAISGELQLGLLHLSQGDNSQTTFAIQPAGDYFIVPHLSIGGRLGYAHISSDVPVGPLTLSQIDTRWLIGIRGGYDLRLGSQVSLWPTLSLSYVHVSRDVGNTSTSGHTVPLEIFVPILFHVVPHLFIGIGPVLSTELASEMGGNSVEKITAVGFRSVVGGYFGP